jgi:hypothetical protein
MKWQLGPWAWRMPSAAAAAVALFGAATLALNVIDAEAVAPPAQLEAADTVVRRCAHCGTITSKREIPPAGTDVLVRVAYEYTVRKADGSSSVFREELPASWRVGERLIFIEGSGADRGAK